MGQPRTYTRQYNFTDFQTTSPSNPLPATQVDLELNTAKLTLDELNANIGLIQRDDGKLLNASVHKDAFDAGALALLNADGFTPRGSWSSGVAYVVNDLVDFNNATYLSTSIHTSSSAFSTDLSTKWILLANAAISGTANSVDKFEGTGSQTAFTLTSSYASNTGVLVFVNGALRNPGDDYSISGTTLTFVTAPSAPSVSGNENVIAWGPSVVSQAASDAAQASSSNSSGFADEAESWASKINGIVESTDYSSKAWATGGTGVDNSATGGSAKDWAIKTTTVDGTNYSAKYWATSTPVVNVSTNISDITTVSGISSAVSAVGAISANVTTAAGVSANITTVAGISSAVSTVAADGTDIGVVSGISADVQTLADLQDGTVATNALATLAGISANITTVAGSNTNLTTVATNIGSVNLVANNITSVVSVASDLAEAVSEVVTVADDLNEATSEINTVAVSIANVNAVGNSIAAVTGVNAISSAVVGVNAISSAVSAVNSNSSNITAVNGNSANINNVAGNSSNINAVSGSLSNVNTVASNLASVNNFGETYRIASSDPTTSLNEGDLYFNTTSNVMNVYDGSSWVAAYASLSGSALVTNNLSDLTNAASARTNLGIDALLAARLNLAGGTMTGDLLLNADPSSNLGAATRQYVDSVAVGAANTIAVTASGGKFYLDGTEAQKASLSPSIQYRFDQSDSSNSGHPLKFSITADGTHDSGTAFTTGVTVVGTAGQAGAYVQITVQQDSPTLYYYCGNHSGMGSTAYKSGGSSSAASGGTASAYVVPDASAADYMWKTIEIVPNNTTIAGTWQGMASSATLYIGESDTIDSHYNYFEIVATLDNHAAYQFIYVGDAATVTVPSGKVLHGFAPTPVGGSSAQDRYQSTGRVTFFGDN